MLRAIAWALAGGVFLGAVPAGAKEVAPEPDQPAPGGRVVTFSDGLVDGTTVGPAGTVVWGRPRVPFIPMIPVRLDFQRELDRSTDEL